MRFSGLTRSVIVVALTAAMAAPAWAQHYNRGPGGYHGGYAPHSQWHGGGYYRGYGYHDNSGAIVGGALLGFGLGALLGGALIAPPPVVYPPPGYYYYNYGPPPYYAYPYAPPPPVYFGN